MWKSALVLGVAVASSLAAARGVLFVGEEMRRPRVEAVESRTAETSEDRAASAASAPGPAGAAMVSRAPDGHYWAEAVVDDRHVRFLVDTGATAVALTAEDARRLGLRPEALRYDASVRTASGESRAARVTLAYVAVAGARVDRVEALVIERGLPASLLGMSFLGRLSRFEATPRALILRP